MITIVIIKSIIKTKRDLEEQSPRREDNEEER